MAISNNRLLKRYAHDSGFLEHGDVHRTFRGNNARGLLLDPTRVPERCDVSGLVRLNEYLRDLGYVMSNAKAA